MADSRYYGTVVYDQGAIIIGPVSSHTGIRVANGLQFQANDEDGPLLPEGSLSELIEAVRTLHNFWNEPALPFDRILYMNFYQEDLGAILNNRLNSILFENSEAKSDHGSYSHERRLVHEIQSGDMKLVLEATEENVSGKHGTVDPNELENAKNCRSWV